MNNTNILTVNRSQTIFLVQFIFLVGMASLAPLFGQQIITGSIVNATLFISVLLLGSRAAFFVGLVPSVIALSTGLLPAVLAPMIPFIMIGNSILILTFDYLKDKNYWLAIIVSSLFKFVFLFSTSSIVINLLLNKALVQSVVLMMSWPQFLTALLGGSMAYCCFTRFYKNKI